MKLIIVGVITFISVLSKAETSLVQQVMELRSQVQVESDQLDALKNSLNSSIQALTVEKGELESKKKMLEVQNEEMLKALKEKEKIVGGEELEGFKGYATIINHSIDELKSYYHQAIPFRLNERHQKIEKLQAKFLDKKISLAEYVEKFWSHLQDEIRLSESVELQTDIVEIEGKKTQVRVLKFGMFQMYFKTLDGRTGYAARDKSKDLWAYKILKDSKLESGIDMLISSKEKQVKGGVYKLPIFISKNGQEIF